MITYRDIVEADAAWMAAMSVDPDVVRYAEPERMDDPVTEDEYRERIRGWSYPGVWWAVLEAGAPVGWVFLRRTDEGWELGYRLGKAAWGRGIATTASRAALDWGRGNGITDVYADVAGPNGASLRIMEKLGFRRTRVGEWHGMVDYRYELSLCG